MSRSTRFRRLTAQPARRRPRWRDRTKEGSREKDSVATFYVTLILASMSDSAGHACPTLRSGRAHSRLHVVEPAQDDVEFSRGLFGDRGLDHEKATVGRHVEAAAARVATGVPPLEQRVAASWPTS